MFARIIIDTKAKEIDRPFTYVIPDELLPKVKTGTLVQVPFGKGNVLRKGYVLSLSETSEYSPEKVKAIDSVEEKGFSLEEEMTSLAFWIRDHFGGTLYQALQLTLPNSVNVTPKRDRSFVFSGSTEELETLLSAAAKKKHYAKQRLLEAFSVNRILPADIVTERLNISNTTLKPFLEKGLVEIRYRDERHFDSDRHTVEKVSLNTEQEYAFREIREDPRTVHLLFGITGSGKTEVYLKLIEECLKDGKEAIVLIPEIALTYQTVMRFYDRFGENISVVHSRIGKGDKCERFIRAKEGEIKIMIGPRSALFTPFSRLGLIIIDEFHENSYISEQVPKYNAIDVAVRRAETCGAKVVLGSATPSVEAYERALRGEYALHLLKNRAVKGSILPKVEIVDMREELRKKNRSIFSDLLREKIEDRLSAKEQVMLFLNRRGYSGAVSCRACGKPVTCPHCSVSLNFHRDGKLKCHICGYEIAMVKNCPACGSGLIGSFGIGTEKVEEEVLRIFPGVRTLRMDADTTKGKDGHEEILEKFRNHEADVLIGTQMIVKGHDFREVTLVGILAADLSLNVPDYRSSERTFQLLTQAEGRAGRAEKPGECIVQTYNPEHYAVTSAAAQDFPAFFESEMFFRKQMKYPPVGHFMSMTVSGPSETFVHSAMKELSENVRRSFPEGISFLGPSEAGIHKVKDQYREILYFKALEEDLILSAKAMLEELSEEQKYKSRIFITFER